MATRRAGRARQARATCSLPPTFTAQARSGSRSQASTSVMAPACSTARAPEARRASRTDRPSPRSTSAQAKPPGGSRQGPRPRASTSCRPRRSATASAPRSPLAPVTATLTAPPPQAGRRPAATRPIAPRPSRPVPVVPLVPAAVLAGEDALPPPAVLPVPRHRGAEPVLERTAGRPAQLTPRLRRVDGVAPVVAGPVGDEPHQRSRLAEEVEDAVDDVQVLPLVRPAQVVALAGLAPLQGRAEAGAMVLHVDPVAHVQAVAVDREGLVPQGVGDHERDELLRELVGAVVVGAAGHQHRDPESAGVSQSQAVAPRLGRRVGGTGRQRALLGEEPGGPERTV